MPVSVVCDAASVVNAALRESIASSSKTNGSSVCKENDSQSIQDKLIASTKRVLLTKIEYEEDNNYNESVLDTLKTKYTVLKPSSLSTSSCSGNTENDKETNQNTSTTQNAISGQQNGTKDQNQLPQPKRILFPRENVQIGWKSSNRKWQIGAGLNNIGNTCFLNATLQALFHVPAMANWLISDLVHREKCENENGKEGVCIICVVSKTLIASQISQSSIKPDLLCKRLRAVCKHFVLGQQEDAHEFLRYLVEAMEKSYLSRFRNFKELDQYSKETTPLNQILGGYLKSAVRCLSCGYVSTTFQHFQDLLLDIRKASGVEDALDGYFSRERIEDMSYKCESCEKKVIATKQFFLERAPVSLCIQLKRFTVGGTKITKPVTIKTRLDLSPYSSKKNNEQLKYKLVSMITHLGGSPNCGHYTAIGGTDVGGYYQFDDSCVRPISLQNVLSTNAYIIFYELEDPYYQQLGKQTIKNISIEQNNDKINVNGQLFHNDNNLLRHNNSSSTLSTNKVNSKLLIGKLDTEIKSTATTTMVSPQLPEKPLLNGYKVSVTSPQSNQSGILANNSHHKLVNSSPCKLLKSNNTNNGSHSDENSLATEHLPKQKLSNGQTSVNRVIEFKSSNTQVISPLGVQLQAGLCKKNDLIVQAKKERENMSYKSETPVRNGNKSTLPSMPLLEHCNQQKGSTVQLSSAKDIIISISNSSISNSAKPPLKNVFNCNPENKSPIKSLVPYEADDDSGSSESCDDESRVKNSVKNNKNTSDSSRTVYIRDSSTGSCTSKSKHKTPPPPSISSPVAKTKTELKHVTNVSPPHTLPTKSSSTVKKNPFAVDNSSSISSGIAPSTFHSSNNSLKMNGKDKEKKYNGKKKFENGYNADKDDGNTVNQLLKYTPRGYGAPVLSWNGQKTEMEKQVYEESRLERKRELDEDEENEMDRGRQKKIKIQQKLPGRDNPGYNPFREYHNNQQPSQHRRWKNHKNKYNGGSHYHHKSGDNTYKKNYSSFHRSRNNFRRNRSHYKKHHRSNGDNRLYHRRDP